MATVTTDWKDPSGPGKIGSHGGSGGNKSWWATELAIGDNGRGAVTGPFGTTLASGQLTDWMHSTGYGLSIPPGHSLVRVEARARIKANSGAGKVSKVCLRIANGFPAASVQDVSVPLGGDWKEAFFVWLPAAVDPGWDVRPDLVEKAVESDGFGWALACVGVGTARNEIAVDSVKMRLVLDDGKTEEEPVPTETELLLGIQKSLDDAQKSLDDISNVVVGAADDVRDVRARVEAYINSKLPPPPPPPEEEVV